MPNQVTSLRSVAVAIAAASLSLAMLSVAQSDQAKGDQQAKKAPVTVSPKQHAAKTHHPKQRESQLARKIYGAAPNSARCAWPYRNMFPPCMSTWPGDDPNFHGSSHPGVTFDEPWEPWWK
jgi:hypothetical protein